MTVIVIPPGGKKNGGGSPPPSVVPFTPGAMPFLPAGQSGGGIPIMPGQFIPPNGFAGFAQQTAAVQSLFRGKGRNGGKRRKRRSTSRVASSTTTRRKKKKNGKRKMARLVKGSAAAKRYMASIRRKRK